jgi:hypothetical protein
VPFNKAVASREDCQENTEPVITEPAICPSQGAAEKKSRKNDVHLRQLANKK